MSGYCNTWLARCSGDIPEAVLWLWDGRNSGFWGFVLLSAHSSAEISSVKNPSALLPKYRVSGCMISDLKTVFTSATRGLPLISEFFWADLCQICSVIITWFPLTLWEQFLQLILLMSKCLKWKEMVLEQAYERGAAADRKCVFPCYDCNVRESHVPLGHSSLSVCRFTETPLNYCEVCKFKSACLVLCCLLYILSPY